MDPSVISALIALAGSAVGTFGGIVAGSKVTEYRLRQLEKKVEQHNHLVERMYALEDQTHLQEEKIKVVNHRINDLEEQIK